MHRNGTTGGGRSQASPPAIVQLDPLEALRREIGENHAALEALLTRLERIEEWLAPLAPRETTRPAHLRVVEGDELSGTA